MEGENKTTTSIIFRLSDEEKRAIQREADALGQTISEYLRRKALPEKVRKALRQK